MRIERSFGLATLLLLSALGRVGTAHAQSSDPSTAPPPVPVSSARSAQPSAARPGAMISLTVPKGTPVQIALDSEVRVRTVGQQIHGRVMQPVYAFDRLVIPAGAATTGHITKIEPPSGKRRVLSALNANFTPAQKVEVEFDEIVLADGKHIPIHTAVAPGSGQVIRLVSAGENEKKKKKTAKDEASQKIAQAKQQARE